MQHHESFILAGLIGLLVICTTSRALCDDDAPSRPDILLIVTDDQRPDSIHALGNPLIRTPSLDQLVSEGMTFTRAITACPICVASRAELLTGRDGLLNGRGDHGFSPHPDSVGIAEVLSEHGYETCYVGKWHTLGRPSDWGYVDTAGLYAGGGGAFEMTHPLDWKGMEVTGYRGWVFQTDDRTLFPEQGVGLTPDISTRFVDHTLAWLEEEHEQPIFLHVNFTAPHDPLFEMEGDEFDYDWAEIPLPENFLVDHPFDHGNRGGRDEVLYQYPRDPEETRRGLAVYYGVISHLDAEIGRLIDEWDRLRGRENTLVIFTSDHGLAMGSHGLRGKQNMYEHSVGVPFIVRGSGVETGSQTEAGCYVRDIVPTLCDYAGVSVPEGVDGVSLRPVLSGESDAVHEVLFAHFRDVQRMIRTDRFKLIVYPQVDRIQLFDLESDPLEMHDLGESPEHAEMRNQLMQQLNEWRQGWGDPTL